MDCGFIMILLPASRINSKVNNILFSTQNVNVARFVRIIEWDFVGVVFQTLCYWMYEIEKVQHAEKLQSSVIVLRFPNALSALLLAPSSFAFFLSKSLGLDVCALLWCREKGAAGQPYCPLPSDWQLWDQSHLLTLHLQTRTSFSLLATMLFHSWASKRVGTCIITEKGQISVCIVRHQVLVGV